MLSQKEAADIVKSNIPDGKIQKMIRYSHLYIFQVFTDDPYEGTMDPFYSVDSNDGEFRDFSIITDGPFDRLMDMFMKAPQYNG